MPVNQKNITIASYNYLQEISAIQLETREKYLEKLQSRKNSSSQKNILLLKQIYFYIDEDRISNWNPAKICSSLKISMNALYIQKSRLLKGLREFYFNWKE